MAAPGLGTLGWWLIALVFVTVLVVFRGAIDGGFVYDDFPRIVEAEGRIASIWPPSWLVDGQRPVVRLSLALNHMVSNHRKQRSGGCRSENGGSLRCGTRTHLREWVRQTSECKGVIWFRMCCEGTFRHSPI